MDVLINAPRWGGEVSAAASKSHLHRLIICSALSGGEVSCPVPCADVSATVGCLEALGSSCVYDGGLYRFSPLAPRSGVNVLDCRESGSTYRFLAPIVSALGVSAVFRLSGRLPSRPMSALWAALEEHGVTVSGKGGAEVSVCGRLTPGAFSIDGSVSSQYISGLLMALPLLDGDSTLSVTGSIASGGYIDMTLAAMSCFGVTVTRTSGGFFIPGGQHYVSPGRVSPEGDWSNAAFWLCSAAVRGGITVTGLNAASLQRDSCVCDILRSFGADVTVYNDSVTVRAASGGTRGVSLDAAHIPDLVCALAVTALGSRSETVFENVERLRYKESDRAWEICRIAEAFGGSAHFCGSALIISPAAKKRSTVTVSSAGDHRMAMLAAVCSASLSVNAVILGADAVDKSYPAFFDDFRRLGGQVFPAPPQTPR